MIYQKLMFSALFQVLSCQLKRNILLDIKFFMGIMVLIEPAKAMRKYPQTGGSFFENSLI